MANKVQHTSAEMDVLFEEAMRLHRAGKCTDVLNAFRAAQLVLPESRRRGTIDSLQKITSFAIRLKDAAPGLPLVQENPVTKRANRKTAEEAKEFVPTPGAAPVPSAAQEGQPLAKQRKRKVFWTAQEKSAICKQAAALITNMITGSRREAFILAQDLVLSEDRRRTLTTMTHVDDWYPGGLVAAFEEDKKAKEEEATKPASLIAVAPSPAAGAVSPPETIQRELEAIALPAAQTALDKAPRSEASPVAPPSAPSPFEPLLHFVSTQWSSVRERLMDEIAHIVVGGIQRGLNTVMSSSPMPFHDSIPAPHPESSIDEPSLPFPHQPFISGPQKQGKQSVLIVGLKGSQVSIIQQQFQRLLDLRFCSSDQSKDQLKKMADAADTSIAYTGFISHAHQDIMKSRSKNFILSGGGMTHLKEILEKLCIQHDNASTSRVLS